MAAGKALMTASITAGDGKESSDDPADRAFVDMLWVDV
jgi:hypothetical protein